MGALVIYSLVNQRGWNFIIFRRRNLINDWKCLQLLHRMEATGAFKIWSLITCHIARLRETPSSTDVSDCALDIQATGSGQDLGSPDYEGGEHSVKQL